MSLIATARLVEVAARRGRTYWLLAQCFGEAPQPALLQEWAAALGPVEPGQPLAAQAAAFGAALREASKDERGMEALAVDYTRLFGAVSQSYGAPPPYESFVRTGSWGGDALAAVTAAYADAEIAPPLPDAAPPDHLAAELRFLAIACHRESEAWHVGDSDAALAWIEREREFLDQHVLCWMPAHCSICGELARTPFYRALAALAPHACELDRADIDEILQAVACDA